MGDAEIKRLFCWFKDWYLEYAKLVTVMRRGPPGEKSVDCRLEAMAHLDHVVVLLTHRLDYVSSFELTSTLRAIPDNKVHGTNTGPTWVLSAPDGPHVGPMSLAIRDVSTTRTVTNDQMIIDPISFRPSV